MADGTFKEMIEKERERLNGLRDEAVSRRSKIDDEIREIDQELSAISAYDAARGIKAAKSTGTGTRATGLSGRLVEYIKQNPEGVSRAAILKELNPSKDRATEGSISNALSNLKKGGKLSHKNGIYASV